VGLADHAGVKLDGLSTGLQRRLAFGRAILHRPFALLLAEPFARCDEASISLLRSLVRRQADEGTASLILASSTAHLGSLCDVIYALEQGRLTRPLAAEETQPTPLPFRIPAREEGREAVVLVNPADVLYASAEGGRAFLQTAGRRLRTRFTMGELEKRLARSGFFRAHRGYLVNLQHVREVIPYTRNSFSLRLDDGEGTEIPLSKMAAGELRELLGY
jgi:ABC-2 type transport system ATP-binding protein